MEHTSDIPPLTTVQQCVVNALAAGSTLTDAAETYGVHRVTVYRWMKTCQPFSAALHRARAEFVLARRDDLHKLSNRALETLLAILDNPKSSPAVLLRTAMFILQRPQLPKTGWSMPEPAPDPDGKKLLDSAIIEQDYDSLPGLSAIEREDAAESTAPEPSTAADVAPCNAMQHNLENRDDGCTPAISAAPAHAEAKKNAGLTVTRVPAALALLPAQVSAARPAFHALCLPARRSPCRPSPVAASKSPCRRVAASPPRNIDAVCRCWRARLAFGEQGSPTRSGN
jgi:hypothetical protein